MLPLPQGPLATAFWLFGLCSAFVCLRGLDAYGSEIIINNKEIPDTGFVAAPLVAIRPIANKYASGVFSNIHFTKDLIVRAATAFPEVKERLDQLGISNPIDMSMADFVDVVRSSDYPDRYLYNASDAIRSKLPSPFTTSMHAKAGSGFDVWDARTLTNLLVTGVVDIDNVATSKIGGNLVKSFKIRNEYSNKVSNIYNKINYLENNFSPTNIAVDFASLKDDVTSYDALQKSMLENIGEITFGVPIIYTAVEKHLAIPSSINKLYDVYWADLVVTYRDVDADQLAEMAFNVAIPERSVALKLIPLRFGVEVTRSQRVNTPELSVEYGGAKIGVGEYFSQTVAFRYLRPTVEAYGEGERIFSWKITDEAINAGSHRFAVIFGVPKGAVELDFAFSGHVRLKKSFIGDWYDGELVAGTDTWVLPVSF